MAKKSKLAHPFYKGDFAIYNGVDGKDVYGDMVVGHSYLVQEASFSSGRPPIPIMLIIDDAHDLRWVEARYFSSIPLPTPTEAGAVEYEEIMEFQEALHGKK